MTKIQEFLNTKENIADKTALKSAKEKREKAVLVLILAHLMIQIQVLEAVAVSTAAGQEPAGNSDCDF